MILYHICSIQRFEEKIAYAKDNGGKLFITPHIAKMDMSQGAIPEYIHCLPNIVGAITFAEKKNATILKITLSEEAKVFHYNGEQANLDFKSIGEDYDVVHTVYNNQKFFKWQEVLLAKNRHIKSWTADKAELLTDYKIQTDLLKNGKITSQDFFYQDFTLEEQTHIARLVGHHVGLESFAEDEVAALKKKFNEAYSRIEAKYNLG